MPRSIRSGFRTLAAASLLTLPAAAHAQHTWEAVPLHPHGSERSQVFAAGGGLLGGYVAMPGEPPRPALWDRTNQTWTDLGAAGAGPGQVLGMDGARQVGWATQTGATLWHGTPESSVSLHPPG